MTNTCYRLWMLRRKKAMTILLEDDMDSCSISPRGSPQIQDIDGHLDSSQYNAPCVCLDRIGLDWIRLCCELVQIGFAILCVCILFHICNNKEKTNLLQSLPSIHYSNLLELQKHSIQQTCYMECIAVIGLCILQQHSKLNSTSSFLGPICYFTDDESIYYR